MKRLVSMVYMVMSLGMFMIPYEATAFNSMDVQKLKTTNQCPNCDLSGASLRETNLSGANLTMANLSGANLSKSYMSGAKLNGATWTDGSKCQEGSVGQCIK